MDFLVWKLFSRYGLLSKLKLLSSFASPLLDVLQGRKKWIFLLTVLWYDRNESHIVCVCRLISKYRPSMPVLSVVIPRLKTNQLRWSFTGAFEVRERPFPLVFFIRLSTCLYMWNLGISNIGMQIISYWHLTFNIIVQVSVEEQQSIYGIQY